MKALVEVRAFSQLQQERENLSRSFFVHVELLVFR